MLTAITHRGGKLEPEKLSNFPKVTRARDASRIKTQGSMAVKLELFILVDSKFTRGPDSKVGAKLEN